MAGVQIAIAALLLRDSLGDKPGSFFTGFRKKKDQTVLRGSILLIVTPKDAPSTADGKPAHNFRVHNDDITLYCSEQDVAPLSDQEFMLLSGIKPPGARYEAFINDVLNWGSKLKVNDKVYVILPSQLAIVNQRFQAIIRWKGILAGENGIQFGVEILEEQFRGKGSTDGIFRGQQLFTCDVDCGMFVSLDKLASSPDTLTQTPFSAQPSRAGSSSSSSRSEPGKSANTHPQSSSSKATSPSTGHGPAGNTQSQTSPRQFTKGNRVVSFNKNQIPIHGTVRWTGEANTDAGKMNIVGIETDVSIRRDDFLLTMTGLHQNFKCNSSKHGKVVLPESLVHLESDVLKEKNERQETLSQQHKSIGRQALKINEQKKPLREYGQQRDEKLEGKKLESTGGAFAPAEDHHFTMNSRIQFSDPPRYGMIRWIGDLPQVNGLIAGVELEEDMEGCFDGTWQGTRYFHCQYGRGFFSPVSNLEPDQRVVAPSQQASSTPPTHREPAAQPRGPTAPTPRMYREPTQDSAPYRATDITVGTAVEIGNPQAPYCGVVRWIGTFHGSEEVVAGIELEEYSPQCGNGTVHGVEHFKCPYGRAYFCSLIEVRRDRRFSDSAPPCGSAFSNGNPLQVPFEEQVDQQVPFESLPAYVGDERGIQGHQNSCYLDSTLFGLFALSDIFDEMFLRVVTDPTADVNRKAVSEMLWKGIVNPLRKNGVVRYESVMTMRNKLEELEKMEGITEKEKYPEEFLNILFKHVLQAPPFISIRRPFGVEKEFFVQLFAEHDPNLKLPTVGELLRRMFREQKVSFTKVPSKLLLQIPRFGREFKTYSKTIPDLKLDIVELTDTARAPECMFCGERSSQKCSECSREFPQATHDKYVFFCSTCSSLTHKKETIKHHKLEDAIAHDKLDLYKLDLLSVICIETSHYVCFTRDWNTDNWIFFDSMADRKYDTYNVPKVTDCTRELNEWVYSGDRTRLMSTQPRQLPELVRRFTQDIYMCVYVQLDVAMYGDGEDDGLDFVPAKTSNRPTFNKQEPPTLDSTTHEIDQLEHEKGSLTSEKKDLQQKIEELVHERDLAVSEKNQSSRQMSQLKYQQQQESQTFAQQLAEKEQQIHHLKYEKQQQLHQLKHEKQQLETEGEQLKQQIRDLQQRLDSVPESSVSQFTKVQIPRQDQDSWNVQRREVILHKKLGQGAWGSVCRGVFRGQQVAVKCAHEEILHENTIDQLKREIRIMAHVQHPNLVRLIAAIVDQSVERKTESPLLVLELLDTDLRSAYKKKVVELKKETLVPILRDVAYALHYLHEHQEPIIHRDVSAPNVLLQEIHPGVWRAKLSDFGSANLAKHCKTAAAGAIIYSAPETFPPRNPYDPLPKQTTKIDVYSYGYLLAESVTKEMPSPEKRAAMLSRISQEWAAIHDIITACTEYEPEKRLTMTQVLEKLHSLPPV